MRSVNHARSSLFLIELIIAILFFSLGAALCVQAFVKAHAATNEARDLAFASAAVSSAASVAKYAGGSLEEIRAYFPEAEEDADGSYAVYYDSSFAPCQAGEADYVLRVLPGREGDVSTARIWMDGRRGSTASVIYELNIRWPAPEGSAS